MPAPVPYLFEGECLVRVDMVADQPWFVAADVCRILGLSNTTRAIEGMDPDEILLKPLSTTQGIEAQQPTNLISEPGLYRLIFRSRRPEAERFKRWIAHEVLPQIRRTGSFGGSSPRQRDAAMAAGRLDVMRRNAAIRMVDQIVRVAGRKVASRAAAAIEVDMSGSTAFDQGELPLAPKDRQP